MKFISSRQSLFIMIGLLCTVIAFHLCVLVGIVPYDVTWGGRLKSVEEMYVFETISLAVTLFLMSMLLLKGQVIKNSLRVSWLNAVIWVFVFLFSLNTIGNLFAENTVEMIVGGLFTFVSAILCYRIARD
jgi:hypothetical protein